MNYEQGALPRLTKPRWPKQRKMPTSDGWNPTLRYRLVQDAEALNEMVGALATADSSGGMAWDTETSGLKPELGARICGHAFLSRTGDEELTGWYVPIRHVGLHNEQHVQLEPEAVSEVLRPLFAEGGEIDTWHGKYDRKMARADGIEIKRQLADGSIEATIFNENEPRFALKAIAEKYCTPVAKGEQAALDGWMRTDARKLGLPYKKVSPKKRKELVKRHGLDGLLIPTYMQRFGYSRSPIHECGIYAIHDVFYTWWLRKVKYREVRARYPSLWEREHDVSRMLFEMEWNGLPADEACIRDTHERTKVAVTHWLSECRRLVPYLGGGFSASEAELRDLYYRSLGMMPPKFTKGGKPSTDKEARKLLEKQYPQNAEVLRAVGSLATVLKLNNTYAGNYLIHYSPATRSIHPSYNQLEQRKEGGNPVTGRLSSADPNAQNVAGQALHLWNCGCVECRLSVEKGDLDAHGRVWGTANTVSIRRYFLVPEGYIRVYIDFSQIELRVLAWFCQDPTMLAAFWAGKDLHQAIADELGITRAVAKQVNFGLSYGLTEIGLALRMPGYYDDPEGTVVRAKAVLDSFFRRFPNIKKFQREFAYEMRHNGCMFSNPLGRPRRIEDIAADEGWRRGAAQRKMMSSIISGTSADICKESMRRTDPIAVGFGGRMVQQVHDELVFDLPLKRGWATTVIKLKKAMEDWPMFTKPGGNRQGVPITVSVAVTVTNWEDKKEIIVRPDDTFQWAA